MAPAVTREGGRLEWAMAGVGAGLAGLAVSYAAGVLLGRGSMVVVDLADLVIDSTPGPVAHWAIELVGAWDKPLLVGGIVLGILAAFVGTGLLARLAWWAPLLVVVPVGALGAVAAAAGPDGLLAGGLALMAGLVTWLVVLGWLTGPLTPTRGPATVDRLRVHRRLLLRAGVVAVGAGGVGAVGRMLDSGRRRVEETRRLLRLTQVTKPVVPASYDLGLEGLAPWQTPNEEFYRIDTAITVPSIDPEQWRLRIHGMVEREVEYTYAELVNRRFTEAWITLNCVSNEVGGDLVGNAWWSGVRVADLLAEARPLPGADAVLQTSADEWTCGTPLEALTDERNALLALAMNGEPLPLQHGFPVRMVVPGLYGYVSATKWLVDLEVTRFADFDAYWTDLGWAEEGPVKIASRIEVPAGGDEVPAGEVVLAGVAWAQHTGIRGVEVAVDGGAWQPAELAGVPSADTWVQWRAVADLEEGDHVVRVRAIDANGEVQTGVERSVLPDGATGWHEREFSVRG